MRENKPNDSRSSNHAVTFRTSRVLTRCTDAVELEPSTSVVVRYAAIGVMLKTDDDDGATGTGAGAAA